MLTRLRHVEPWYGAYALQGVAVAGLVPILLPLAVSRTSTAASVGLVMAMVSLGGLAAPLWGGLADRYRLHRPLLSGGLALTAIGIAAFAFTSAPSAWVGLALLQGLGTAAAATVAGLFIVEAHAREEWDVRIGWLQASYGGGQVAGLLLAGLLGHGDPRAGLLVAAALAAVAALVGGATTRTTARPVRPKPVPPQPARHAGWAFGSPQRHAHYPTIATVRRIDEVVTSSFGDLLAAWMLSFAGAAAYFALYPVLMARLYAVDPAPSSVGFAVAAGLGLALYSPAGRWSDRLGAMRVLRLGLLARLLAFAGLCGLALARVPGRGGLAVLGFGVVVLAWSLLSVSGTALAAQWSPVGEGEGLGLFNAATALAGVIGAAAGGWAAGRWGYGTAAWAGAIGVACGLLVTFARRDGESSGPPGPSRRGG